MGFGVFRVEFDGLLVAGDSILQLVLVTEEVAELPLRLSDGQLLGL